MVGYLSRPCQLRKRSTVSYIWTRSGRRRRWFLWGKKKRCRRENLSDNLPSAVRDWKPGDMKARAFISIGTKGTSLPLKLAELTLPLKIGVNVLRWAGRGKVPEAAKAHAWVSNNGKPFELYPLDQAIEEGRVRRVAHAAWTGQADGQRHVGEAFFPDMWQPGDPQPLLVAVYSKTWGYGCVELKLIPDGRNRATVARFEPASLQEDILPAIPQTSLVSTADEWTDDELRAAVANYLQMLRCEQNGQPYRKIEFSKRLREEFLLRRSRSSVDFRMRHISAALSEIGHPWLMGFTPQVGLSQGIKTRLIRLLREVEPDVFTPYEPSSDEREVAQRTGDLLRGMPMNKPVGETVPRSVERMAKQFVRSPAVQAFVRQEADGTCELCQEPAPFVGDDGLPFLEVHHVVALADDGPDTVENAAALCPNCHRHLHHGRDRLKARARLYSQVSRLHSPR